MTVKNVSSTPGSGCASQKENITSRPETTGGIISQAQLSKVTLTKFCADSRHLIEVRESLRRGLGVFAKATITRGTRVLVLSPILGFNYENVDANEIITAFECFYIRPTGLIPKIIWLCVWRCQRSYSPTDGDTLRKHHGIASKSGHNLYDKRVKS